MHTDGKILCHLASLNGLNDSGLKGCAPLSKGGVVVQLGPTATYEGREGQVIIKSVIMTQLQLWQI